MYSSGCGVVGSMQFNNDKTRDIICGLGSKSDQTGDLPIGVTRDCLACGVLPCACNRVNQPAHMNYGAKGDGFYATGQNLLFGIKGQICDAGTDLGADHFQSDQFWVTTPSVEPHAPELIEGRIMDDTQPAETYKREATRNVRPSLAPLEIDSAQLPLKKSSKQSPQKNFDNSLGTQIKDAPGANIVHDFPVRLDHWKQQSYNAVYLDFYSQPDCQKISQSDCIQDHPFVVQPQVQKQKPVILQQFFNQPSAEDRSCPTPQSAYFPSQNASEPENQAYAQQAYHTQKSQGLHPKLDGWVKEGQEKSFLPKNSHVNPPSINSSNFCAPQLGYVGLCSIGNIPQLLNQEHFETQKCTTKRMSQVPYVYRTIEKHENTHPISVSDAETFSMRSRHSNPRPKLHVTIPDAAAGSTVRASSSVEHDHPARIGYQTGIDNPTYRNMLDIQPLSAPLNHVHPQPVKFPYGDKACLSYSDAGYIYPYIQTFGQCDKPRSATTTRSPHLLLDPSLSEEESAQLKGSRFGLEKGKFPPDIQNFATSVLDSPIDHSSSTPDISRDAGVSTVSPLSSSLSGCAAKSASASPKGQIAQFGTIGISSQSESQMDKCGPMHRVHQPIQSAMSADVIDHESTSQYSTEEFFRCRHPGCNKIFPKLYNLKSHVVCHSDSKPHKCSMCGKAFARKHDLQRHLRTIHSSEHPFQCDLCRGFFPGADALRKHRMSERNSQGKADSNKPSRIFSETGLQKQQLGCE